ncbi:type III pantothenate kinase [Alishewanella longhuensis]
MYLLLDVGNSRVKAVSYSLGQYTPLATITADSVKNQPWQAVYVASVAAEEKIDLLQQQLGLTHLPWHRLKSEASAFSVTNSYHAPEKLGVDRWLAMQGAVSLFANTELLIVDAGTALTLDWLNQAQQHEGGWIIPGVRLQQEAVINNTAKVLSKPGEANVLQLGTDTLSCVENGALAAVCGAIRLAWQLKPAKHLILTGGDAAKLTAYLTDLPIYHDPLLIFRGVARYINS